MTDSKEVKATGNRRPPAAGKGRVKGTPNKITKALKDMILGALDTAGGEAYLVQQATENPTAFLTLIGKVLPSEVNLKGQIDNTHTVISDQPLTAEEWTAEHVPPSLQ